MATSMGHDHPAHLTQMDGGKNSRLIFLLILYLAYLGAEVWAGFVSGSLALLADAGHMAIDTAAIALTLFSLWISRKPPTSEKTYGYYRAEILAALLNGALLIVVAGWILFEAWQRTLSPTPVDGILMTFVAFGGLVVNILGLALLSESSKGSLGIRSVWWHILSDTLGSGSATLAGLLVWYYGWTLADPILSLFIGVLILRGSWKLVLDCVNVLLEGVPKGMDITQIKTGLESFKEIKECHDLHVWTVASGVHALSAHLCLREGVDHGEVLDWVTQFLKDKFHIDHVTIQLEPPTYRHAKMQF